MEGLAFLGIFLGCFARMMVPYLKKLKQATCRGETLRFERRYIIGPGVALVLSAITAMLVMPTLNLPSQNAFFYGGIAGWGASDLLNELMN